MNLDALALQVAGELNDVVPGHEFTSWPKALIESFILDALQVLYQERKDLFTEEVVLEVTHQGVTPGCGCTDYTRVLGQSTSEGTIIQPLRERADDAKNTWTGTICRPSVRGFRLKSYTIFNNGSEIKVTPLPPGDVVVYIKALCATAPTADNIENLPEELQPAIIQWALFKAKMIDAEHNPTIFNAAVTHQNTFWSLINRQAVREGRSVRAISQSAGK